MPSTSLYGSSSGTFEGPGTAGQTTTVTKITSYSSTAFVYGIELEYGGTSKMFGVTNEAKAQPFNLTDDPVYKIEYVVSSGQLRGLKFSNSTASLAMGLAVTATAFNDADYLFTDMETYKGVVGGFLTVLWGAKFYYVDTTPSFRLFRNVGPPEMAWPLLAVMAHVAVVAKSLTKVGQLRRALGITAPSCDPPLTTSPSDAQLWYRTFRAQENCKEMFLVYLPSILIASTMGYHAFGKWVPRTVGALTLLGAFFRYKYLNAYIEDSDKRAKPFYQATLAMKPIFFLAVASSGYVLGKELYHCVKGGCSARESSEEQEQVQVQEQEQEQIQEQERNE